MSAFQKRCIIFVVQDHILYDVNLNDLFLSNVFFRPTNPCEPYCTGAYFLRGQQIPDWYCNFRQRPFGGQGPFGGQRQFGGNPLAPGLLGLQAAQVDPLDPSPSDI